MNDGALPANTDNAIQGIDGFNWGFWSRRGSWTGAAAEASVVSLAEHGARWITLCIGGLVSNNSRPDLSWGADCPESVTDEELRNLCRLARAQGLKVCFKPIVDSRVVEWRAHINFDAAGWQIWWRRYHDFLDHYAVIAEEEGAEGFCLGCEMISCHPFSEEWRSVAARVRSRFSGWITYNANHGDTDDIDWWDAVDAIGVSAYYCIASPEAHQHSDMVAAWQPVCDNLAACSARHQRPVLFMEIGCRSTQHSLYSPAAWKGDMEYEGMGQRAYYEATFSALADLPWLRGIQWWKWPQDLDCEYCGMGPGGTPIYHRGFCPAGKPAADVLRDWWPRRGQHCNNVG